MLALPMAVLGTIAKRELSHNNILLLLAFSMGMLLLAAYSLVFLVSTLALFNQGSLLDWKEIGVHLTYCTQYKLLRFLSLEWVVWNVWIATHFSTACSAHLGVGDQAKTATSTYWAIPQPATKFLWWNNQLEHSWFTSFAGAKLREYLQVWGAWWGCWELLLLSLELTAEGLKLVRCSTHALGYPTKNPGG